MTAYDFECFFELAQIIRRSGRGAQRRCAKTPRRKLQDTHALRLDAAKGRKVLSVYDRAIIDFEV